MAGADRKIERLKGTTLMELLAVMAIAILIMAAAVPGMRAMLRGSRLRNATVNLTSAMRLARQAAVAKRMNCYIYLNTTNQAYAVSMYSLNDPTNDPARDYGALFFYTTPEDIYNRPVAYPPLIDGWNHLPQSIGFSEDDPPPTAGWYRFSAAGTAYPNQNFRLIDGNSGKYVEVRVNNVTGRVSTSQ